MISSYKITQDTKQYDRQGQLEIFRFHILKYMMVTEDEVHLLPVCTIRKWVPEKTEVENIKIIVINKI